jgi:riboflavin biosynthesis pyrimidine reductase/predicted DsbA family dithiol-disulfide isomerase
MTLNIPIAHDFICPWCWVGLLQARRLQQDFHVSLEWRGYELFPDELEWPDYPATPDVKTERPATPSRFDFLLAAEGIVMPTVERPKKMRTHNAHEAVEYAKTEGVADQFIEVLYRAYWEQGQDINDPKVLKELAKHYIDDRDAMLAAIEEKRFKDAIIGFDDDAHSHGVWNVPTFFIGGQRLAEQPYRVLKHAVEAAQEEGGWTHIYRDLGFPSLHEDRPYTYINMVATIDGKIITGERDETVVDLGSKVDHQLMRRLEATADAVMIGAETLRSTAKSWSPRTRKRIVVTRSGNLPEDHSFFSEEAYVAAPESSNFPLPKGATILHSGNGTVDFGLLLTQLKGMGVNRLLVLGGSILNAELIRQELADELFLTIAPKVKLGRDVPTYAGGNPLSRDQVQTYKLVENHAFENEVFLRYRRERKK